MEVTAMEANSSTPSHTGDVNHRGGRFSSYPHGNVWS